VDRARSRDVSYRAENKAIAGRIAAGCEGVAEIINLDIGNS